MKPRIGFFDFTGCEGCQLSVLNLESEFLELLELVEFVEFREVITGNGGALDIAFVEGSICRDDEVVRLRTIRERSRNLVALGACADTAGVNALATASSPEALRQKIYGCETPLLKTFPPSPLSDFVDVDARIPGCPIDGREFLAVLQALLMGRPPELPAYSLCVECKLAELPCTFEHGEICLGPVTRAGCDALCLRGGDRCRGCRGLIDAPRSAPYRKILEQNGLSVDEILREFRTFNVIDKGRS
ncbi:MAG: NADH:ubiquinone oxidoreductase [Desulfuromonas sp.]|nr:MAG: NADH:ubiquinone oxidoreductase [Desulfuromonas sp.]